MRTCPRSFTPCPSPPLRWRSGLVPRFRTSTNARQFPEALVLPERLEGAVPRQAVGVLGPHVDLGLEQLHRAIGVAPLGGVALALGEGRIDTGQGGTADEKAGR